MHPALEDAIEELLTAWRAHDDNRRYAAPLRALTGSRTRLDAARTAVTFLRRRLAPTPEELAAAALTTTCDVFQEMVSIGWAEVAVEGDGLRFECVCGSLQVALRRV